MSRIAYVNGRYLPQREAAVNIEDRGYQFADGIYEVVHLYAGRFVDEDRASRPARPLAAAKSGCATPMSRAALRHVLREVARRNRVTRGAALHAGDARRGAARPRRSRREPVPPALVVTIRRIAALSRRDVDALGRRPRSPSRTCAGRAATSRSIDLLPNVLARQAAREQGAIEAILFDARRHGDRGRGHQFLDRRRRRRAAHPPSRPCRSCPAARAAR